ncbi:hypothetical protein EJ08DRAFT_660402 [Tothia fuscella]|uniref:lytic cellulose monooxygenase (C4-dehydrogenating) n=1 Tax=Tothia fuscella TaxID=1048955 RepID=A0A9P4NRW0_9PEZI|nr:hypothetical protein EJ08DRAFT_660402 [Tothia fuscella]
MAPYSGDIANVNVPQLEFFKFHEDALHPDGSWATDKMIAQRAMGYHARKYVVRHELTSLHFATKHSNYSRVSGGIISAQFYMSSYNVEVVGGGIASPPGVKFPGGYNPSGAPPKLEKDPLKVISLTGTNDKKKDEAYIKPKDMYLTGQAGTTDFFQSIGD